MIRTINGLHRYFQGSFIKGHCVKCEPLYRNLYHSNNTFFNTMVSLRNQTELFPQVRHFHAVANNMLEPCLRVRLVEMFDDNYGYVIIDEANQTMIAVDPADPEKMMHVIREEEERNARELVAILTTHKHWDHAGGNQAISEEYPDIEVLGPEREPIPSITKPLKGGEKLSIGRIQIEVLFTPCHTSGHVVYLITGDPQSPPLLFSGDTLFVGGCGRFFEGDASDMYHIISNVLTKIPLDARIYCGHEYTLTNLRFALSIDPTNHSLKEKMRWAKERRNMNLPTIPSTYQEELSYNPFLRVNVKEIQKAVGKSDPIGTLAELRSRKDNYQ